MPLLELARLTSEVEDSNHTNHDCETGILDQSENFLHFRLEELLLLRMQDIHDEEDKHD